MVREGAVGFEGWESARADLRIIDSLRRIPRGVIKIAIDKRLRESENRRHEENLAGSGLPAPGRLWAEEADGRHDPTTASHP
jgi:hypothetical protein